MTPARWLALAALLGGCAAHPHEQRYAGRLDGCDGIAATLVRSGLAASFAPGDGALVLHGEIAPDGGVAMALNTQPPGKPPFMLTLQGHVDAESARVTYATPRCTAHGTLPLVHPGLF